MFNPKSPRLMWAKILRMTGAWVRKPATRILLPKGHSSGEVVPKIRTVG